MKMVRNKVEYISCSGMMILLLFSLSFAENYNLFSEDWAGFYLTGIPDNVRVKDSLLFVKGRTFFDVFDISEPDNPVFVKEIEISSGMISNFLINQDFVYLWSGKEIDILDISDIENLHIVKQYLVDSTITDMDLSDTLIFVSMEQGLVRVFNVKDPTNFQEITDINTGGGTINILLEQDIMYVADRENRLIIFDISDIFNPVKLSSHDDQFIMGHMVKKDNILFTVSSGNVELVDVSDPSNPVIKGTLPLDGLFSTMLLHDTLLFVASVAGYYIDIFNVSTPSSPEKLSSTEISHLHVSEMDIKDNILYLAHYVEGIDMLDISSFSSPQPAGGVYKGNVLHEVEIKDSLAFVTESFWSPYYTGGHLMVFNVSDRSKPVLLNSHSMGGEAGDLVIKESTAFVAVNTPVKHYLVILNISDPLNIEETGRFEAEEFISRIITDDTLLYLTEGRGYFSENGSIEVVDISNLSEPEKWGEFRVDSACYDLVMNDTLGYLLEFPNRLHILNMKNPASIEEISFYETQCGGRKLMVKDTLLYMAGDGFCILNVKDPQFPTPLSYVPGIKEGNDMEMKDSILYISGNYLYSLNVADPHYPYIEKAISPGGYGLFSEDSLLYLASQNGLFILCFDSTSWVREERHELKGPFFITDKGITYVLERKGHVRMDIYNLAGQLVHTPVNSFLSGGSYSVELKLPPGIYFVELKIDDKVYRGKIVKID